MRILLPSLVEGLGGDERSVLLTLARMIYTATTGRFTSKDQTAAWAKSLLSKADADLLSYARLAYLGEVFDHWTDRVSQAVCLTDELTRRISALLD